jgi:hypothetical protein
VVIHPSSQGVVVICSDGVLCFGKGWFLLLALTRWRVETGWCAITLLSLVDPEVERGLERHGSFASPVGLP